MDIINRKVSELIPYGKNAKKHDKKQIANVAESLRKFGWKQPVVIDENNVIVIGHGRVLAAKSLGMEEVPCLMADDLTPEQIRQLRIVDNKTNESGWDLDLLKDDLLDTDLSDFDFDFGLDDNDEDNPYSEKVKIPQYQIKGDRPTLDELTDSFKADELLMEINASTLPEEEKKFLRMAAYRHYVFNYKKIAEYYAQASEQMQNLMEKSALVIIDLNDAIANGYCNMMKKIKELEEK